MKKIYSMLFLLTGSTLLVHAQSPVTNDTHNFSQGPGGSSTLFANDVIVAPSAMREHGTSISVAFNGWIYEATGFETMDSDSSGGIVRVSKDNGTTWTTMVNYLYANVDYISPEIEVAGTDTNNLSLFIAGAWYDSTSGAADIWVDKYNARNGSFIGEVYNESMQYPVRDLDIATDYRYPAFTASPYSVGLIYSHFGTYDSIIFVSSGDGGATWGNRRGVAGTGNYYDEVSLAYGISSNYGFGRYFAAWEERSSFSNTTIGKIKTAHCQSGYNSPWSSVFCLDSLDQPNLAGVVRHPRISCQYNGSVNNDSNGISTVVVFERAYAGDTSDCDIIGFYSLSQPNTNNWYRFDVINDLSQALQPDVSYDPMYNNFLLTYYNRTGGVLQYFVHQFNMINPTAWPTISSNYCDQPSMLKDPWPRVIINPAVTQAAFSWTQQATPTREQAMFDAEYVVTGVPASVIPAEPLVLYPNPAQLSAVLNFSLEKSEKVSIDICDVNGRLVMNLNNGTMNAGPQVVTIPAATLENGNYLITVTSESFRKTTRLIVAR